MENVKPKVDFRAKPPCVIRKKFVYRRHFSHGKDEICLGRDQKLLLGQRSENSVIFGTLQREIQLNSEVSTVSLDNRPEKRIIAAYFNNL